MTNKKYGIGIIGCGNISYIHAEAISKLKKADLVSVFSRNIKNAEKLGKQFGVNYFNDWNQFISEKKLDIVSICTPNGAHLDYGKLAAAAGKHVVVEKPIEISLERGRQLIKTCQDNKIRLAVIYQNRFLPDVIKMKEIVKSGRLGKIFQGDAYVKWYRSQDYYDNAAWRGTLALDGGGVLINQAIHTIDLLQWMLREVETIYGKTGTFTHKNIEGEDVALAIFQFKSGAVGVIEASTSVLPGQARKIEIHGSKGSLILNGDSLDVLIAGESEKKENPIEKEPVGSSSPFQGFSVQPHLDQFKAIVNAIDKNEQPPVSGKESLKSLAIVKGIYESAEKKSK